MEAFKDEIRALQSCTAAWCLALVRQAEEPDETEADSSTCQTADETQTRASPAEGTPAAQMRASIFDFSADRFGSCILHSSCSSPMLASILSPEPASPSPHSVPRTSAAQPSSPSQRSPMQHSSSAAHARRADMASPCAKSAALSASSAAEPAARQCSAKHAGQASATHGALSAANLVPFNEAAEEEQGVPSTCDTGTIAAHPPPVLRQSGSLTSIAQGSSSSTAAGATILAGPASGAAPPVPSLSSMAPGILSGLHGSESNDGDDGAPHVGVELQHSKGLPEVADVHRKLSQLASLAADRELSTEVQPRNAGRSTSAGDAADNKDAASSEAQSPGGMRQYEPSIFRLLERGDSASSDKHASPVNAGCAAAEHSLHRLGSTAGQPALPPQPSLPCPPVALRSVRSEVPAVDTQLSVTAAKPVVSAAHSLEDPAPLRRVRSLFPRRAPLLMPASQCAGARLLPVAPDLRTYKNRAPRQRPHAAHVVFVERPVVHEYMQDLQELHTAASAVPATAAAEVGTMSRLQQMRARPSYCSVRNLLANTGRKVAGAKGAASAAASAPLPPVQDDTAPDVSMPDASAPLPVSQHAGRHGTTMAGPTAPQEELAASPMLCMDASGCEQGAAATCAQEDAAPYTKVCKFDNFRGTCHCIGAHHVVQSAHHPASHQSISALELRISAAPFNTPSTQPVHELARFEAWPRPCRRRTCPRRARAGGTAGCAAASRSSARRSWTAAT